MTPPNQTQAGPLDRPFSLTIFDSVGASRKLERNVSLTDLAKEIRRVSATAKMALPWLKMARFGDTRTDKNSLRHDANLLAITGIEADYDGEVITVEDALNRLSRAGVLAIVYTSPSHTEDTPRWRILCPTSAELPPNKREHLVGRLNGLFTGSLANESFTLSQAFFFGSVNHSPSHQVEIVEGEYIDLVDRLDLTWQGRPYTESKPGTTTAGPVDRDALSRAIMSTGDYHMATVRLAGLLARQDVAYMVAREQLIDAYMSVPEQQRDARWQSRFADIDRCLQDIYLKEAKKKDAAPEPPSDEEYALSLSQIEIDDAMDPDAEYFREPEQPTNPLPMVWYRDIEPVLDVQDFVEGLLVSQTSAVVYGESNAGKTFWTTDLALHVAAGIPWNGRHVEGGGVIYVVCEGKSSFANRVYGWKKQHQLFDIPFASVPVSINMLDPSADTPRLIAAIKSMSLTINAPVKLVVIDTLARSMAGGDENSSQDMGALVGNMDAVRAQTGATVLFIHHSGKDTTRGARGHSSLRAAVDTEIEVVADEEAKTKSATVVKQRDLKKGDVFGFEIEPIVLGKNKLGKDVTTCIVRHTQPSSTSKSKLKGHVGRAFDMLCDKIAKDGVTGFGVPEGVRSIPLNWWREKFYRDAMPEDSQEAKQKAFKRAVDKLLEDHKVAYHNDRVWLGSKKDEAE